MFDVVSYAASGRRWEEREADRQTGNTYTQTQLVVHPNTSHSSELSMKMLGRMEKLFQAVIPTIHEVSQFHKH